MSIFAGIARILRAAADEAEAIAREDSAERRDWIAQADSPLGPRRHISAARRRLSAGLDGVSNVGRKWLLSPEALRDEMGRLDSRVESAKQDPELEADAELSELRRELALVRGGRR